LSADDSSDASSPVDAIKQQVVDNQKIIDELNKDLSRKTQEVHIIQEISREINATLELDEILATILQSMDETFGFRHSMILLLEEGKDILRVAASRGYTDSGLGAEVKVGQGVIGVVAKKRKLMRMGGIGTQMAYANAVRGQMEAAGRPKGGGSQPPPAKMPGLSNVQSQVAIPLMIKDRLIGVFAVESPEASVFEDRDEVLIAILANQAASAIHKAKLHAELKRHTESLEEMVRERTADLRRAQAQLVQSEKMAALGLLVAGIAHEINTPMGAIASTHDTVFRAIDKIRTELAGKETPTTTRVLAMLGDASKLLTDATARVTTIVRRLRSFARLDEAELKEADLNSGIDDTLALVAHELKGIQVTKELGPLPLVTCYPGRLNQVFLNLIVNARQALGDKGGEIHITTAREGDHVAVSIRDTGCGIPDADLAKVFDPGFTTKGVGVGTGLGLSICYQIVEEQNGTITIDSAVGRGTTVTVRIPIRPS
jgi:signal transduction histidine kinase